MSAADRFDELMRRALQEADQISCTPQFYRDSLGEWVEEIRTAIAASKETDPDADDL